MSTMNVNQQTDPRHQARVRLPAAGIAQGSLPTPPDASKHSRAIRISKVKEKVDRFRYHITAKHLWVNGSSITITEQRLSDAWIEADIEAWKRIGAALEAGEPLASFLAGI